MRFPKTWGRVGVGWWYFMQNAWGGSFSWVRKGELRPSWLSLGSILPGDGVQQAARSGSSRRERFHSTPRVHRPRASRASGSPCNQGHFPLHHLHGCRKKSCVHALYSYCLLRELRIPDFSLLHLQGRRRVRIRNHPLLNEWAKAPHRYGYSVGPLSGTAWLSRSVFKFNITVTKRTGHLKFENRTEKNIYCVPLEKLAQPLPEFEGGREGSLFFWYLLWTPKPVPKWHQNQSQNQHQNKPPRFFRIFHADKMSVSLFFPF